MLRHASATPVGRSIGHRAATSVNTCLRITSAASEKEKKPAEKTANATEKTASATEKTATETKKMEGRLADAVALLGSIDGKIGLTSARFGE